MRVALFNPYCGAAGNMILGALIDAGAALPEISDMLASLNLEGEWELSASTVSRRGLRGLLASVNVSEDSPTRNLSAIAGIISSADLPEGVKRSSISCFNRLAAAEAEVHGVQEDEVHFHETGAVDAMIDIVGSFSALHLLGVDRVFSSAVAIGTGTVDCAHGTLPVPAPATALLLSGVPVSPSGIMGELTTPTGAAILREAVRSWDDIPPPSRMISTGMGAGSADFERANLVRVSILETGRETSPWEDDTCVQITAIMDDIDLRTWPEVSAAVLDAGAYECYCRSCLGRKGRPSIEMTVLCPLPLRERLIERIFRSTPTLGMRVQEVPRAVLSRKFIEVDTEWGHVNVKVGFLEGEPVNIEPEYAECVELAEAGSVDIGTVITSARANARSLPMEENGKQG